MNKYYVCTPFWRSIECNKRAFVEAKTASEAASMVLGGKWKRSGGCYVLPSMATVYKLNKFELLPDGRIDAIRTMHYEKIS